MAKEKELETARLRAKQERAADRQAEIDELRARRSPFLPSSCTLAAALPLLPIGKASIPLKHIRNFKYSHRPANQTEFQKSSL